MKRFLSLLIIFSFLLTGCGASSLPGEKTVACTTYPVYLMAQAVTKDIDGFEPVLVINQQISCLHDYTLTMTDMKLIEQADLLAINGGGLEDFLSDVLEGREYIDCSAGLTEEEHDHEEEEEHGHDHDHSDAHIWLDPELAGGMAVNLAEGLAEADPEHGEAYRANALAVQTSLSELKTELKDALTSLSPRELITFHDGFQYFAQALDLDIVAAVEEEEGSEASARRITELVELIDQYHLPAIFTEVNGSDSTAQALAAERDITVFPLNLGMSSNGVPEDLSGLEAYEWILRENVDTLLEAYQ